MNIVQQDGVARLQLAHPPVNALGSEQVDQITQAVRELDGQMPLLISGQGPAFCAGVDTKAFAAYSGEQQAQLVYGISAMTLALLSHPAPMVAAVNGHALGGGLVLMLCADYRLLSDDPLIKLGLTEAAAGIPFPAGPLEIIRHTLNPGVLRQLTLSSRIISPQQAIAAQIADDLCPADKLLERGLAQAVSLAEQPAFAAVKQQVQGDLINRLQAIVAQKADPLAVSLRTASL